MPRRKQTDPASDVLAYFSGQPYEVAKVVQGLMNSVMLNRATLGVPVVKPQRRKRQSKPVVAEPTTPDTPHNADVTLSPTPKQTRKRRMRADSAPPPNEAKPIVPLQAEVGGDDSEAYTGN